MNIHQLIEGNPVTCHAEPDFQKHYDIIVVGLGAAGSFCALAAREEGAKTVLGVERATCCGGMTTNGCVNGYYYGAIGGAYEKIDEKIRETCGHYRSFGGFHPDAKKVVLEETLLEAGVTLSYRSTPIGIFQEGDTVRGIRLLTPDGVSEISCTVLVDATSEGHLVRTMGIQTAVGRESDGQTQPFSSVRVFLKPDGSLGRTNFDSGYLNQYDAEGLSEAIIRAHANHVEKAEQEEFLFTAPLIGVREGLHFLGEETLTLEDILEQREFPKVLLYGYSDIDKHGKDLAFDDRTYQDWFMLSNLSTVAVRIPIPLGSIVPKGYRGFLTAGRCLSMDSYAASSVRMNRDMYRLGEAVGVACAYSLPDGGDVRKVSYPALQERLRERGCYDPAPERKMGFNFPGRLADFTPVSWMTEPEEIRKGLDSDQPGVALWSCRRLGTSKIGDALSEMLKEPEERLRYHAALALGLIGDPRALPILREIAENRSAYFFRDCRRTNQLRSANAICLLGRLGDRESMGMLLSMLRVEEIDKPLYHVCKEPSYQFGIESGFNLVYYQHFSNAVGALLRLAETYEDLREEIFEELEKALGDGSYRNRITKAATNTAFYQTADYIRVYAQSRKRNPLLTL